MAADRELDEKTVVEPTQNDNGHEALSTATDPPSPEKKASDYANGDLTFDTGLMPWLQVMGSFFLFFNSWYVRIGNFFFIDKGSWISGSVLVRCADRCAQGRYKHIWSFPDIL